MDTGGVQGGGADRPVPERLPDADLSAIAERIAAGVRDAYAAGFGDGYAAGFSDAVNRRGDVLRAWAAGDPLEYAEGEHEHTRADTGEPYRHAHRYIVVHRHPDP